MSSSAKPTVMVVDDFHDIRSLLRLWLEKHGCYVVEAADGLEAVEVAKRERPSLILMDLYLPEIDGYVATARIRKNKELQDMPIVAITAYGDPQLRIDPLAVGFNAYLTKPFGPEHLEDLLDRFLPKSSNAHPPTAH